MAIPSGSGTEVLKRTTIHNQSNTTTSFRWDGTNATTGTSTYVVPADFIITVLSIIFCEVSDAAEILDMAINDGTNNINILQDQEISAEATFVFNDKLVLQAGDKLFINLASSGNVDAYCSYIIQDWT